MKLRRERGFTLVECAAALALAGFALASTAKVSQAAATLIRHSRALAETVDVARNLLEYELGAPCAAPLECPRGYRCSISRSVLTAAADRVSALAERIDGGALGPSDVEVSEQLHTAAPAAGCGG